MKINDKIILNALKNDTESIKRIANELNISYEELSLYLSKSKKIKKPTNETVIFIDGASRGNPGESGIGIKIIENNKALGYYRYIGKKTNNQAEYNALINALRLIDKNKNQSISVFSDSELLCNQINGIYAVKNEEIAKLYNEAINLIKGFKNFKIKHIPRSKNEDADKLANIAIEKKQNGEIELAVARPLNL